MVLHHLTTSRIPYLSGLVSIPLGFNLSTAADLEASIYKVVRVGPDDDYRGLVTEFWFPVWEHSSIRFGNIGNITASCSCLWGTTGPSWHDVNAQANVVPGESYTVGCSGGAYYVTGMKVYNAVGFLVLIFASRGEYPVGPSNHAPENKNPSDSQVYEWDYVALLRTFINLELAGRGVGTFLAAGFLIELCADLFFPKEAEKDPWDEVKEKVKKEIDNAVLAVIVATLGNDIKPIEFRIRDIKNNINDSDIRRLYINLADQIYGYDTKFSFKDHDGLDNTRINMAVLRFYARMINLQINFYSYGVTYSKDLKLTDSDVKRLKRYLKAIVPRAVAHVEKSYADRIKDILYNADIDNFFNLMMGAHAAVEFSGRAYYYDWYRVAAPDQLPEVENRTGLGYSEYYGYASPDLYKQAFLYHGAPPLTPRMTGPITRSQWSAFRVYNCWNINLCGLEIWFDNGDYHAMGELWDSPRDKVDFNGRQVIGLIAAGQGCVRGLIFQMDDDTRYTYGHSHGTYPRAFNKPYYYIAGMFVSNDLPRLGSQIVNVAVSFQMQAKTYNSDNGTIPGRIRDLLGEIKEESSLQ